MVKSKSVFPKELLDAVDEELDIQIKKARIKHKTFLDEKLEKTIPKKTQMEKIREDFEDKVKQCQETQKKLTCKYDEKSAFTNPWACQVCECKKGKYSECEDIRPVKHISTVYPDELEQFRDEIRLAYQLVLMF